MGGVAVEVCMQMAVVVRACVQRYATRSRTMKVAGTALLVLCTVRNSSDYAYAYCTITIHALT